MGLSESEVHLVRAESDADAARAFRDQIMFSLKTTEITMRERAAECTADGIPEPMFTATAFADMIARWLSSAKTSESTTRARVLKSHGLK